MSVPCALVRERAKKTTLGQGVEGQGPVRTATCTESGITDRMASCSFLHSVGYMPIEEENAGCSSTCIISTVHDDS